MNRVEVARFVRAVGLICALAALVAGHRGHRYWDDGTFAALVLVLAIPAVLGIGAAFATGRPAFDRLSLPLGSVVAGLFLFVPVGDFAFGSSVDAPYALGFCALLVPLSLLVGREPGTRRRSVAGGLAPTLACGLLIAAVWPDAVGTIGYWNWPRLGHGLGICLLVLALLGLAATALSLHGGRLSAEAAVAVASVAGGFGLYVPAVSAFGFDSLGAGAWLGAAGGLTLLASGVLLALRR